MALLLIAASIIGLRAERARIDAVRDDWGPTTAAWVATSDQEAGHLLREGDLVSLQLPPVAVPADAVTDPPYGRRLADPLGEGEVVRLARLRGGDVSVNGSRVGPGRGAVALSALTTYLEVGDRVDLYGLLDGAIVAAGAEIITVADGQPVVAVDTADLPKVIQAFTVGDVVPVLVE